MWHKMKRVKRDRKKKHGNSVLVFVSVVVVVRHEWKDCVVDEKSELSFYIQVYLKRRTLNMKITKRDVANISV